MQDYNRTSGINTEVFWILFGIIALVYIRYSSDINDILNSIKYFFSSLTNILLLLFKIILVLTVLFVIFLVIFYIISAIFDRKERKKRHKEESDKIEILLHKKLSLNHYELVDYIKEIKDKILYCKGYSELLCFIPDLEKRHEKALNLLEEFEKENKIKSVEKEIRKSEEELEDINEQIREKQYQEQQDKNLILRKLDVYENSVFKKEELSDKEVKVLLENNYSLISEYDVSEKKQINVLVRDVLNHSKTHTFLVWSVKRLLNKIKSIYHIEEHLTKDADITFYYKGKKFALEIETGTLLNKHEQLKVKIDYLNGRYQNRWMFVLTNRDLISKYRKLGPSTPRNQVYEKLLKMTGI